MENGILLCVSKRCSKCKENKSFSDFTKDKSRKDGYYPQCKQCRADAALLKRDNSNKYKKDWYLSNKERILELRKDYYEENLQTIKEYKHSHYKNNKERYKENAKNSYKTRYNANPKLIKDKNNKTSKRWRNNNKHIVAWRTLLKCCLSRMLKPKNDKTLILLGYSAEELKVHLEKLWTPQMSWENYGEWHIDHIKPVISFEKDTLPSIVNALSNLQPLWATNRIIDGVFYQGNLNKNKYG